MASLTNEQINQTYESLIKTVDNTAIDGSDKGLTDGNGNALPLEVSTSAITFTGTADFTNATVTGITDENTTYDFGAAGAAGNINLALTGSDATNDVVSIQAGTNITLTDNGSNTFTIDAAGGGGGATQMTFTNGTIVSHTGADPQGILIDSILIPANTITGPAVLKWECPLTDGPEGAFTYTSVLLSANAPINDPTNDLFLGRQGTGGGADGYNWQRMMTVDNNGNIHLIDHNNYSMPTFSPDGIITRAVDWTLDQYFSIGIFIEAPAGTWTGYSPSLTIMQ